MNNEEKAKKIAMPCPACSCLWTKDMMYKQEYCKDCVPQDRFTGAMEMAQWKDEQFESDRLFLEEYKSRCHFYEEFIKYLHDECVGVKDSIIEAVSEHKIMYIGYVDTEKEIKPNGDLIFKFKIDDLTYRATWQESDNYAVCQWTGYEPDDYKGYLLFPTFGFKKFFCI